MNPINRTVIKFIHNSVSLTNIQNNVQSRVLHKSCNKSITDKELTSKNYFQKTSLL